MRVAVIGLGAAGLAAAAAAAERGAQVVGYEQFDLDHQPASSGGRGKIIRFGYGDPFYADLMISTYPRWQRLAAATGRDLLAVHGGLHMGSPADIETSRRIIAGAGQRVERADPERFGVILNDREAVFEPTAGVMWTSAVRAALAEVARSARARLRIGAAVERLEDDDGRPIVRTAEGSESFDRVILSGGPWAFRLAPELARDFEISRRFQVVFATERPLGDGRPRPWMDHAVPTFYGMINVAAGIHLIGLHEMNREQVVDDPDEPDDDAVRAASIEAQLEYVRARFGIDADVIDIRRCHYTSTASEDFVIDEIDGRPGVILLSACSGHGFKFTITTGALAAGLAFGEAPPDRFRLRAAARATS
jgi:sarcosine oxidase